MIYDLEFDLDSFIKEMERRTATQSRAGYDYDDDLGYVVAADDEHHRDVTKN